MSLPLKTVGVGSQASSMPSPGDSLLSPLKGAPAGAIGPPMLGWKGQVCRLFTEPEPLRPRGSTEGVRSAGAQELWSTSRWLLAFRKKTLLPGVAGFERWAKPPGDDKPDCVMLLERPQVSVIRLGAGGFSGLAFSRMNVVP